MDKVTIKRKKSKIEKGFLLLLATPDILFIIAVVVAGLIYFLLR